MKKKRALKKSSKGYNNKKSLTLLFIFLLAIGSVITLSQISMRQENQTHAAGDCTVTASQMTIKPAEQQLFDLINNYRVQHGLGTLTWNNSLKRAAAWMSHDMYVSGNVSHMDSLGRTQDTRLFDCGATPTNTYGENLSEGAYDATQIIYGWEIDTPKNDVLLNPQMTIGAIAVETDTTGQLAFWTLDVAGPSSAGTANPTTIGQPTTTTSGVPSGVCLGGCPIITPTDTPTPTLVVPTFIFNGTGSPPPPTGGSNSPSGGANPPISGAASPGISGSVSPSIVISGGVNPSGTAGNPGGGSGGPGGGLTGGFFGFLLALIALLIKFLMSLIGR